MPPQSSNEWADFWRYVIGVNVIPADTIRKKIHLKWSQWQDKPIPESQHEEWKKAAAFKNGLAIMAGKVWHRPDKYGSFLVLLDLDKRMAIQELSNLNGKTISLEQLASKFLVEQHQDDISKAHVYFYSKIQFAYKNADADLGIEVKSMGKHGVSFCCNSVHMNKDPKDTNEYRYRILGDPHEPATLSKQQAIEMMNHINGICIKHGIEYLAKNNNVQKLKPILKNLVIDNSVWIKEGERHLTLLSAADSLLITHLGDGKSVEMLKAFFIKMNASLCHPEPLAEIEIERIWRSALEFASGRVKRADGTTSVPKQLSVSQALREKIGYVKVTGQLIGQSQVYNMIYAINFSCSNCNHSDRIDYGKKPLMRSLYRDLSKCPWCDTPTLTLRATFNYCSTTDIELQDPEKFSEIERLSVKLFEHNTEKIIIGESVTIVGSLYVVRKNDNPQNKLTTVLFAESLEYASKEETALTIGDIEEIEEWKRTKEKEGINPISALVSIFAPEVIGNEHTKEGLLMVAANAGIRNDRNRIPRRLRIHQLLIGDPSSAKSTLLQALVRIVVNGRYESCQSSTGLSLTAQVSKEEGGSYILRAGPIPQARDSLCALNEVGQMPITDHKHLLDFMEEGESTLNKFGFNARIAGHTSIVASANPLNNTWKNFDIIDFNEFPTLVQIIHRFDFISIFREITDEDELKRFATKRSEIRNLFDAGSFDRPEKMLKRYIMYARNFHPVISEEAKSMLNEFWVKMAAAGVRGLPRKLDSLERAVIARAKLKLKNVADGEEAIEVMHFFNAMLCNFAQTVALTRNPRDIAVEEICQVVKELNGSPIAFVEAAKIACEKNQQLRYYIGTIFELSKNWKIQNILTLIRKNPSIELVNEKPVVLRWRDNDGNSETKHNPQSYAKGYASSKTKENEVEQIPSKVDHLSGISEVYEAKEAPAPKDPQSNKAQGKSTRDNNCIPYASDTSYDRYLSTIDSSNKPDEELFPRNLMYDPKNVLDGMQVLKCYFCKRFKTPIKFDMEVHLQDVHKEQLLKDLPLRGKGFSTAYRAQFVINIMKQKKPREYYDHNTATFAPEELN
jgi:DNA replicative helicase MCM subunit Mcm2 (Cdc46/Mcm family)